MDRSAAAPAVRWCAPRCPGISAEPIDMAGERFVRNSVGARDPERSNGARGAGAAGARFPVLKDNSRGSATRDFGVLSGVDCGVVVEGAKAIVNMAKAWDVLR